MYQSKTDCKRCGKRTLLIRLDRGKTFPCELEPVEFVPDLCGTARYVLEDGTVLRGCEPKAADKDIHSGWMDHRDVCPKIGKGGRR